MTNALKPQTLAAHYGVAADEEHHAVAPPINLSATYGWEDPTNKPQYDYARSGNPTRALLEGALSELEGGSGATITATGMAAIDLPMALLGPQDLLIAPHDCYGGTHRLLMARNRMGHCKVELVNQTDDAAFAAAMAKKPKMVLLETPSNPLLRVTDLEKCAAQAKAVGAIVAADNTFLSPAFQNPLAHGCDLVMHSTTKFINGHSDVVGGVVIAKDAALAEEIAWWGNCTGVTGAPFDSYMTLRGLRTLFPRVERQQQNAQAVIAALQERPEVVTINYPGLEDHPGHAIAAKQQSGFGAMFSAEFADGFDVIGFLRRLKLFTIAESLGGFESLICTPAAMTHAAMPPEARAEAGISETLTRFSIGLEHQDDLIADLVEAIKASA